MKLIFTKEGDIGTTAQQIAQSTDSNEPLDTYTSKQFGLACNTCTSQEIFQTIDKSKVILRVWFLDGSVLAFVLNTSRI